MNVLPLQVADKIILLQLTILKVLLLLAGIPRDLLLDAVVFPLIFVQNRTDPTKDEIDIGVRETEAYEKEGLLNEIAFEQRSELPILNGYRS